MDQGVELQIRTCERRVCFESVFIEPDGTHARRRRTANVVSKRIADVHTDLRRPADSRQRLPEDLRATLVVTALGGRDDSAERIAHSESRKRPLQEWLID